MAELARRMAPRARPGRSGWPQARADAAGVMARKFIAGATPDEALQTVLGLRRRKLAFTADLLGEAVISEAEADWYQQTCLAMIARAGRARCGTPPRSPSSTATSTGRSLASTSRSSCRA